MIVISGEDVAVVQIRLVKYVTGKHEVNMSYWKMCSDMKC